MNLKLLCALVLCGLSSPCVWADVSEKKVPLDRVPPLVKLAIEKVWEENPLDGDSETKTYAPGIGLIQDEGLLLIKHGFVKK